MRFKKDKYAVVLNEDKPEDHHIEFFKELEDVELYCRKLSRWTQMRACRVVCNECNLDETIECECKHSVLENL